jgi:hypothetical protein
MVDDAVRPALPPVWPPPEQPATPVLHLLGGFDDQTLAGLAAETALRAHSLLHTLTQTDAAATTSPAGIPAEADWDGNSSDSRQLPHIPLQQRLQELQKATGMTKAELAQAVRDWGLSG